MAPAALASSSTSANWAGYAAHRAGVRFRSVSGEWRVPTASCTAGLPGYSSVWTGLGGYRPSSTALEQTGTETDCTRSGQPEYFAWYELVPAAPHSLSLGVKAGDLMRASVSASGGRVTITISDLTDGRAFSRGFYASQPDTTSAEWIVEAPSECTSSAQCFPLPLTDFGQARVFAARATTGAGRTGAITSRWWASTQITLVPHGPRFIANITDQSGEAVPSALTAAGSAFTVSYQLNSQPGGDGGGQGPFFAARRLPAATLIHPPR